MRVSRELDSACRPHPIGPRIRGVDSARRPHPSGPAFAVSSRSTRLSRSAVAPFQGLPVGGAVTQGCARLPDLVSEYFGQAISASLRFSLNDLARPPTSTDPLPPSRWAGLFRAVGPLLLGPLNLVPFLSDLVIKGDRDAIAITKK